METARKPFAQGHPTPLRIAVLGGGIAGLSAAIALSRVGHKVDVSVLLLQRNRQDCLPTKIFEQPDSGDQESYVVADLTPNITGLLRRWGVRVEDAGAVDVTKLAVRSSTGEETVIADLSTSPEMWQHPWQQVQSLRLYQTLRDIAIDGIKPPATLHKSATLASADPEAGRVLMQNGTAVEADVIVGADGLHVSGTMSMQSNV